MLQAAVTSDRKPVGRPAEWGFSTVWGALFILRGVLLVPPESPNGVHTGRLLCRPPRPVHVLVGSWNLLDNSMSCICSL